MKDKNQLERLEDIAKLPTERQTELFNVMDAYLRDYKTSKAITENKKRLYQKYDTAPLHSGP